MFLVQPVESRSVFGWLAWIVIGQVLRCIGIVDLLFLWWFRSVGVVDLGPAEVSVFGTFHVQVVQHALVVDALGRAAAKKTVD
jgi:hypothetical protein